MNANKTVEDKPKMFRAGHPAAKVDILANTRKLLEGYMKGPKAFHQAFEETFPPTSEAPAPQA